MFWGLVLEPGKRYAQTVDKAFHISMASLDVMHSENELVSVNVSFQNAEFILCNLQKHKVFQTPLDLNFMAGDKIAFYTSGKGRVHLTGYLIDEDDDNMGIEADDDESEEEQIVNDVSPQKNVAQASKQEKRKSVDLSPGKPALKKSKMEIEDEEDDDDSDIEGLGESDEELEVESGEEEEDEDDDGEEDEDDTDESEEMTPQKQLPGKNKEKQQSAQKQQQNKQPNTPNEMKKKKDKTPGAATPNTPSIQANGTREMQSGKKNKKKGGETPGGQTPKPGQTGSPQTPQKKILEGGVAVEDSMIGSGQVAKPGRFVTVYYTGRLKQNNKKFDETVQGPGFKFRLGKGEVIKGWDIGVTGMKVGGKRKLIIPPHMAYGAKGSPPVIPPNSALVFEVELRNVN